MAYPCQIPGAYDPCPACVYETNCPFDERDEYERRKISFECEEGI